MHWNGRPMKSWQWLEIHGNLIWGPWLEVSSSYDPPDNYQPLQMNTSHTCTGGCMLQSQLTTSLFPFSFFPGTIKPGPSPPPPPRFLLPWLQNVHNRLTGLVIDVSFSIVKNPTESGLLQIQDEWLSTIIALVHKDAVHLHNSSSTSWQVNVLGDKKFSL